MADDGVFSIKETARCPSITWNELAEQDSREVPAYLKEDVCRYLGSEPLSTERYAGADFFRREIEKMWPNVWQFAARDEELPHPGDYAVYENAGRSYLIVRQEDGSVKAFHNVCLHRGRKLRTENGDAAEFRCPFHGFTWNTDGSFKTMPCAWDFPHLAKENMSLPEAETGRWDGYIFVRENAGGPSLEEFLAPLPDHFHRWSHAQCYTSAWAAKVVPANWKACAEAFMEAFHVIETHPQIMPFTGDANSKYNIYGDNVNIAITPFGVSSPHIADHGNGEQWIIDQYVKYNGRVVVPGTTITVPEGQTARQAMGAFNRERFGKTSHRDLDFVSDAEAQDAFTYNVFPNFSPWGGFAPNVVYRWRPWPDQDHTMMEVRVLTRVGPDDPMPPCAPMRLLKEEEPWAVALGQLGAVVDQDMGNLPYVQDGMKLSKTGKLNLANYQEIRIRHFHQTLDKYLEK